MVILSKPHVALLSSPGLGHLIPIIELAKRLVSLHNFTVTIFVVTTDGIPAEADILLAASTSNLFDVRKLPRVNTSFPPETDILSRLALMMRGAIPALRSTISDMKSRPTAMIVDLFGTEAIKVAEEFNMVKYVYFPSNALFLAFTVYFPYLDGKINAGEDETLRIPGCSPIPLDDIIVLSVFKSREEYLEFERTAREIKTADGILINTWEDLEAKTLGSYRDEKLLKHVIKAPVYPVGPLVRTKKSVGSAKEKSELIRWLDTQPGESVLYVSFGSGGTLSTQQTVEVACGLEWSQQRFIWVIRPPIDHDASATTYFESSHPHPTTGSNKTDIFTQCLPNGFLDRTRDVGRVVPMWAPQDEILAHTSVGGFLSHCGWNSTLEGITNGVPMITWPLYAEQDMNATMLTLDLRVAVRPSVKPSKELVSREEIGKMVRKIMVEKEGRVIRSRVKELQKSGEVALSAGGSSLRAFSEVAKGCEMSMLLSHVNGHHLAA